MCLASVVLVAVLLVAGVLTVLVVFGGGPRVGWVVCLGGPPLI